ncbi:MAG: hypothetical protein ACI8P3_003952, partial [Saprospiraceae bacterium]
AGMKAEQNPVTLDKEILMSYVGEFGPRVITYKDENLFYSREGRTPYRLIPMNDEMFRIEEIPYFRIKMIKENGKITGILGMYDNGRTDKSMKGEAKKTSP